MVNAPENNINTQDYRKFFAFLLCCAFVFLFITVTLVKTRDADIWYHLKTGQYIYQQRAIPKADIFSSTALGNRWISHEWLFELLSYLMYSISGINGLIISKVLLILLTYLLVYRIALALKANPFLAVIIMSLAIFFAGSRFDIRAHLFTDFFLSLLLFLLVSRKNRYLFIALLFFVWAQFHSGFIFGLLLIGLFIIGEFLSKNTKGALSLLLALFIAFAACLINPNGYLALFYPFLIMQKSIVFRSINEYLSPFSPAHTQGPIVYAFVIFLVLGTLSFLPFLGRQKQGLNKAYNTLTGGLIFLVFALLSIRMIRNFSMLAIVGAPLVASNITSIVERYKPKLASNSVLILAAIAVISLAAFNLKWRIGLGVEQGIFSEEAMKFLESNNLKGRMLNSYTLGGYIIWKLFPKYKVFIDGRNDVYGPQVLQDYNNFMVNAKDVEGILKRRDIRHIIIKLPETNTKTITYLLLNDNWDLAFFDNLFVIFVKNSAENARLIKDYAYDAYIKLADRLSTNIYLRPLAIISYKRATAIDDSSRIHLKLAMLYENTGMPKEAKREYLEALRLDPKNIAAYTNLGLIYISERDFAQAKQAWQKAAEIDSNSLAAKNLKVLEQMQ